jgi:hypothetical protein
VDAYQQIFLSEIEWQSSIALEAMTLLRQSLPDPSSLRHVQTFLVAAANVSKRLWMTSNKERSKNLRSLLNVADDSPIANRDLRNHFEHFGERIERWATESANHAFVDRTVIAGTRRIGGLEPKDTMRIIWTPSLVVSFQNDTYNLKAVEQALKEVHELAQAKKMRGWFDER